MPASHYGKGAADEIVHQSNPLGGHPQSDIGKKNVIVNEGGAMPYLYKEILAHHAPYQLFGKLGALVVMKKILGNPGALGFPVAPDAHGAVVDIVAAEGHVDGGVHLDAGNLSPTQFHHIVDVMDVVVFNQGENAAHPGR